MVIWWPFCDHLGTIILVCSQLETIQCQWLLSERTSTMRAAYGHFYKQRKSLISSRTFLKIPFKTTKFKSLPKLDSTCHILPKQLNSLLLSASISAYVNVLILTKSWMKCSKFSDIRATGELATCWTASRDGPVVDGLWGWLVRRTTVLFSSFDILHFDWPPPFPHHKTQTIWFGSTIRNLNAVSRHGKEDGDWHRDGGGHLHQASLCKILRQSNIYTNTTSGKNENTQKCHMNWDESWK